MDSLKKPDTILDLNKGIIELFDKRGIKSIDDLRGQVAECCIQLCDCCLQVSRERDYEDRIRKIMASGEFRIQ